MFDDDTPIRTRRPTGLPTYLIAVGIVAFLGLGMLTIGIVAAVGYSKVSVTPTSTTGPNPTTRSAPVSIVNGTPASEPVKVGKPPAVVAGAPTAAKEGLEWSVEELAKYLKAKGTIVDYEVNPATPDRALLKISNTDVQYVHKAAGKLSAEEETKPSKYEDYLAYPARNCSWGAFVFLSTTEAKATKLLSPLRGVMIGHYEQAFKPTFRKLN